MLFWNSMDLTVHCQLLTFFSMDQLRPREIVTKSWLWRDANGAQWLVVFDFTMIRGRLECCGLSLRSFLRDRLADEDEAAGSYSAWWDGDEETLEAITRRSWERGFAAEWKDDEALPDDAGLEDCLPQFEPSTMLLIARELAALANPEVMTSGEPADASIAAIEVSAEDMSQPQPLRSTTLRQLPLANLIGKTRRFSATPFDKFPPESRVAKAGGFDAWDAQRAAMWTPKRGPRGRVAKYSPGELEMAAEIYGTAYKNGDRPTKAVAEALGISRNQAAKLVMKCRAEGILGPARAGVAGGILTESQTNDEPRQRPTRRRSSNDEGGSDDDKI